ncbi:MAG TPA: hypothetical protein VMG38_15415 [Trebonia sp.]|nr:hypothetical protein [Trebonia sp.]
MDRCACGYEASGPRDKADHLGEVFIPLDDVAPDGRAHAEAAREVTFGSLACVCGFAPAGPLPASADELDAHLLLAFTPADGVGLDGRQHR